MKKTTNNEIPISLLLKKAEANRIIREVWLIKGIMMLLFLVAFYLLWQWTKEGLAKEEARTQSISTNLQKSKAKLNQVSQEEQEMISKSNLFRQWQARRVIATLNELDIQEFLYMLAKHHGISEFEYSTDDQGDVRETLATALKRRVARSKNKNGDNEKPYTLMEISVLAQEMKFKIQHEKQLFDFLFDVTHIPELADDKQSSKLDSPKSLARLNNCEINRINPKVPLSPTKVNFSANCQIQWINFVAEDN